MVTKVVDLSHHQMIPSSLKPVYDAGIRGVIHKVTEGDNFKDDKCFARYTLAKSAGLLWGVYHFLRPGDVDTQLNHFYALASTTIDNESLIAVDHEDSGFSLKQLVEFLSKVQAKFGRSPLLYSGNLLKEQLKWHPEYNDVLLYRLWLAQYTSGAPSLPVGFNKYYLWQFTDKGVLPGINGTVDLNDYQGPEAQLRSSWAGWVGLAEQPNPPVVTPPPSPQGNTWGELVVRVTAPKGVRVDITYE